MWGLPRRSVRRIPGEPALRAAPEGRRSRSTCSTCHDPVAGDLLSPKALEKQCSECHGPKEVAPRAERARNARTMYQGLNAIREQLKLANAMIKRVDDKQRRAASPGRGMSRRQSR
ncbi:MAG: hypothetical protein QM736_20085 [Vicinamibacterales bacterium]